MTDPENNIANIFGVLSPAMEKILIERWYDCSPDPYSDLHVLPTTRMKLPSTKGTLPGPAHNWRRGSERHKKGNRRKVSTQTHNKQACLLRHRVLTIIVILCLDSTVIGTLEKS